MPDVYFVGSNEFFSYVSHTSDAFSAYEYLPTQTLEKEIKLEKCDVAVVGASPILSSRFGVTLSKKSFENFLFKFLALTEPSLVIFLSSVSVYGLTKFEELPFRENAPTKANSAYAYEKMTLEDYLGVLVKNIGSRLVCLRMSGFFGVPNQLKRLNFIDRLEDIRTSGSSQSNFQKMRVVQNGDQIRDFCKFDLAAEIIKLLIKTKKINGTFNLSTTPAISLRDYIQSQGLHSYVEYEHRTSDLIHCCVNTDAIVKALEAEFGQLSLIQNLKNPTF